jgi:hypothetical protein
MWQIEGVRDAIPFGGYVFGGIAPLGVFDGQAVTVTVEKFKCSKKHHLWYIVTADKNGKWNIPKSVRNWLTENNFHRVFRCGACGKYKGERIECGLRVIEKIRERG